MRVRPPTGLELRALLWVLRVAWWSRFHPLDDLMTRLESVQPRAGGRLPFPGNAAIAAVAAVRRVHRFLPLPRTCLMESLAALGLLRSLGSPAHLTIGVRAPETPVEAHAWLEVSGKPLDPTSAGYTELRLPRRARPVRPAPTRPGAIE